MDKEEIPEFFRVTTAPLSLIQLVMFTGFKVPVNSLANVGQLVMVYWKKELSYGSRDSGAVYQSCTVPALERSRNSFGPLQTEQARRQAVLDGLTRFEDIVRDHLDEIGQVLVDPELMSVEQYLAESAAKIKELARDV